MAGTQGPTPSLKMVSDLVSHPLTSDAGTSPYFPTAEAGRGGGLELDFEGYVDRTLADMVADGEAGTGASTGARDRLKGSLTRTQRAVVVALLGRTLAACARDINELARRSASELPTVQSQLTRFRDEEARRTHEDQEARSVEGALRSESVSERASGGEGEANADTGGVTVTVTEEHVALVTSMP